MLSAFPKTSEKYYPSFVNQQQTDRKIHIQISTISKILSFCRKRKVFPNYLLFIISSFVFPSPICFYSPVYHEIGSAHFEAGKVLIYNEIASYSIKLQIKKIWKGINKQMMSKNVMRFAALFEDFISQKLKFLDGMEVKKADRWKIISENNFYYLGLFKILSKYKKDGVLNQLVLDSFMKLMSKNMVWTMINCYQNCLIIESNAPLSFEDFANTNFKQKGHSKKGHGANIQLKFVDRKIMISCKQHRVFALRSAIQSRNTVNLLDPETLQEIRLDDIFFS